LDQLECNYLFLKQFQNENGAHILVYAAISI